MATTSSPAFEVGLLTYKVIGWICCVVFVGASVGAFLALQFGPAYCFLLFIPLGAYLIASAGSILISENNVVGRAAHHDNTGDTDYVETGRATKSGCPLAVTRVRPVGVMIRRSGGGLRKGW